MSARLTVWVFLAAILAFALRGSTLAAQIGIAGSQSVPLRFDTVRYALSMLGSPDRAWATNLQQSRRSSSDFNARADHALIGAAVGGLIGFGATPFVYCNSFNRTQLCGLAAADGIWIGSFVGSVVGASFGRGGCGALRSLPWATVGSALGSVPGFVLRRNENDVGILLMPLGQALGAAYLASRCR